MKAPCKNFWESLHYALNGLKLSSQEPHFRLMLVCALVAVIAAILLGISLVEWSILILLISTILSLETVNTLLEKLCDYLQPNISPQIKVIKDLAAGAVLILCLASLIIAGFIFIPKIINFLVS
ncbi:MAG: diacylglycerol kinase [Patescibacteria group bacterium]|nr:diacylglycerol kinase [Patescibacteria group bacterium]